MNKRLKHALFTTFITASLGLSFNAQADIKVYVKNCAYSKVRVSSFHAKDSAMTLSYQSKKISSGDSAKLKCKGQGKGYCKLIACNGDKPSSIKVRKGKWVKVTDCGAGYQPYYKNTNSDTEPSCN